MAAAEIHTPASGELNQRELAAPTATTQRAGEILARIGVAVLPAILQVHFGDRLGAEGKLPGLMEAILAHVILANYGLAPEDMSPNEVRELELTSQGLSDIEVAARVGYAKSTIV